MNKWNRGNVGTTTDKKRVIALLPLEGTSLGGGQLYLSYLKRLVVILIFLTPTLVFSQDTNPVTATPSAALVVAASNAPATTADTSVAVASEKIPWVAILGVALVLGVLAFVMMRLFGGEEKRRSSGRSRGGWILSSTGVDEAHGGSSDDEESSSSSFNGGGAGSNW